jgi:hypothetical protein
VDRCVAASHSPFAFLQSVVEKEKIKKKTKKKFFRQKNRRKRRLSCSILFLLRGGARFDMMENDNDADTTTADGWETVEKKKKPVKAPIPKPRTLEEITNGRSKVMIVLRGLPGAGKVKTTQPTLGMLVFFFFSFFSFFLLSCSLVNAGGGSQWWVGV